MPAIAILYPVTVKGLLITMTPWLAGSVIIGAWMGRQRMENRQRNNILARQQAAIEQLQAQRPARPILTTSTNTPSRSIADHETKHSLLQRILENNLSLRQDIEQSTRDE